MPLFPARITDHRGRRARMLPGMTTREFRGEVGAAETREISRDIERRFRGRPYRSWQRTLALVLPILIALLLMAWWAIGALTGAQLPLQMSGRTAINLGIGALAGGVVGIVIGLRIRRRMVPIAVESLLSHGRCPACSYDLRETPPEPDDCRVCPECGAAWRIDDAAGPIDASE